MNMRRRISGGVTTAAGLVVLVVGLAAIDSRVRDHLGSLLDGNRPSGELANVAERVQDLGLILLTAVRDQSIQHAPLTIFALGGLLLLVFMLRTSP
jgi:hypothetical protein